MQSFPHCGRSAAGMGDDVSDIYIAQVDCGCAWFVHSGEPAQLCPDHLELRDAKRIVLVR